MGFELSERNLRANIKNEETISKAADTIAKDLASKTYDISELVEALGFALTSTNVNDRLNGTRLLSETLYTVPKDVLKSEQLNFLVTFYVDRFKDHHSVIPSMLRGVLALIQMNNLPEDSTSKLLSGMFSQVACQSQLRPDREVIFQILKYTSETYEKELKAMGSDYIVGVINAIDGERDPRNLLYIFQFMPKFLNTYNLGHLSDDMFETFACYFPVDFHPTKENPDITREVLSVELAKCLCGSASFAENSVDLAIEKLESTLTVAKIDSFKLLSAGTRIFEAAVYEEKFDQYWPHFKEQLLPGTKDSEIQRECFISLGAIVTNVSQSDEYRENLLNLVYNGIATYLSDVTTHLFEPALHILFICVQADKKSAIFIVNKVLPILLYQYSSASTSEISDKQIILKNMVNFIRICELHNVTTEIDGKCLNTIKDEAIQSFASSILTKTSDQIESSTNWIVILLPLLTENERFQIYDIVLKNTNSEYNIQPFKKLLRRCGDLYKAEVKSTILEVLLNNKYDSESYQYVVELLSILLVYPEYINLIIEFIYEKVFKSESVDIQYVTLKNLNKILEEDESGELQRVLFEKFNIIDQIYNFIHVNNFTINVIDGKKPTLVLQEASNTLKLIVQSLKSEQQFDIIEKYLPNMDLQQVNDLYFTSGLLSYLDCSVNLDNHFERLFTDLMQLSLNSDNEELRTIANHLVCSLCNKIPHTAVKESVLKKSIHFLKEEIKKHNKRAVELLAWISKGLMINGYTDAAEIIQDLADLLNHPSLATVATLAFEIIAVEIPGLHLPVLKKLFKQKIFQKILKKIENEVEQFAESHLKSLTYLFKMVPHLVLKINISTIGPILFKCLELKSAKHVIIALHIIKRFIEDKDLYMQEHLQTLIPLLLKLTVFEGSLHVRITALECLIDLKYFPLFVLLPFKYDILSSLGKVVDDKKRLVRIAAVRARNIWSLLGAPGFTEDNSV